MARRAVADDRKGYPVLLQFPGGQARALQTRAGFIHQHENAFTLFVGRADDAQRGAPIDGGQRAGVAMMDDGIAVVDQRTAPFGHALVDSHVLISNALRFRQHLLAQRRQRLI